MATVELHASALGASQARQPSSFLMPPPPMTASHTSQMREKGATSMNARATVARRGTASVCG